MRVREQRTLKLICDREDTLIDSNHKTNPGTFQQAFILNWFLTKLFQTLLRKKFRWLWFFCFCSEMKLAVCISHPVEKIWNLFFRLIKYRISYIKKLLVDFRNIKLRNYRPWQGHEGRLKNQNTPKCKKHQVPDPENIVGLICQESDNSLDHQCSVYPGSWLIYLIIP